MRDSGYVQIRGFLQFTEAFPTEEACRSYLFSRRWPNGFACPRCGGVECYHVSTRDLYECRYCRYQASLTAGTIMEKTQTPLLASPRDGGRSIAPFPLPLDGGGSGWGCHFNQHCLDYRVSILQHLVL